MALHVIIDPSVDTTFGDSVRRLLGGVSEVELSDEYILDPAIFDVAEMEILSLVPCLESGDVSNQDKNKARLAMIYLIASKLCPVVKGMMEYEVRTIDVSWKKKPIEYDELQEILLGTVDTLLSEIDCYEGGETASNLFRVAPSKRGVKESEEL